MFFEVSSLSERSGEKPAEFMESSQDLKRQLTRLILRERGCCRCLRVGHSTTDALAESGAQQLPGIASLGSLEAKGQVANYQQETGKLLTINCPLSVRVQELKEKHSFIIFSLGLIQWNFVVFGLTLAFDF